MVRRRRKHKIIVSHRMERTPLKDARQNRRGEAHLHRNKSREISKFEALDSAEGRTQQSLNQRSDFAQAKRECKRLHDEYLTRTQEAYRAIPREKDTNLRATKNMTTWLTLKQVGGSTKGRGETCRQLRQDRGWTCKQLRHHRQRGTKPIGRRAIGILSILQALTTGDFFSELGQVSVARRKNLQPTDWVCEQYTHKYSTYRVAQHDHISSREHAWLKLQSSGLHIFVSFKAIVIHVSCLQIGSKESMHRETDCSSERER